MVRAGTTSSSRPRSAPTAAAPSRSTGRRSASSCCPRRARRPWRSTAAPGRRAHGGTGSATGCRGRRRQRPRCLSCRLTRRRPESDDTLALELLAEASVAKRRLVVQLLELGLPITAYYEREGGLAFDMISSRSGNEKVIIGHANGVITIDLAETLDAHREALRVSLGEPYRTMLGHLRHEVGHYYQGVLVDTDERWGSAVRLFGDERASYQEAIARHYADGAPDGLGGELHLRVRHDAPVGGLRRDLRPLPPHHRHPRHRGPDGRHPAGRPGPDHRDHRRRPPHELRRHRHGHDPAGTGTGCPRCSTGSTSRWASATSTPSPSPRRWPRSSPSSTSW